jgi:hypothetical protein
MFADSRQHSPGRPPADDYDRVFIKKVAIRTVRTPRPRFARLILAGWVLIAGKCWLVTWLIGKYHVPIDPLWVIGPTLLFALLCTAVYFRRE